MSGPYCRDAVRALTQAENGGGFTSAHELESHDMLCKFDTVLKTVLVSMVLLVPHIVNAAPSADKEDSHVALLHVRGEDCKVTFIRDAVDRNLFYYLPAAPEIRTRGDQEKAAGLPDLDLLKYQYRHPSSAELIAGGLLRVTVRWNLPEATQSKAAVELANHFDGLISDAVRFMPVPISIVSVSIRWQERDPKTGEVFGKMAYTREATLSDDGCGITFRLRLPYEKAVDAVVSGLSSQKGLECGFVYTFQASTPANNPRTVTGHEQLKSHLRANLTDADMKRLFHFLSFSRRDSIVAVHHHGDRLMIEMPADSGIHSFAASEVGLESENDIDDLRYGVTTYHLPSIDLASSKFISRMSYDVRMLHADKVLASKTAHFREISGPPRKVEWRDELGAVAKFVHFRYAEHRKLSFDAIHFEVKARIQGPAVGFVVDAEKNITKELAELTFDAQYPASLGDHLLKNDFKCVRIEWLFDDETIQVVNLVVHAERRAIQAFLTPESPESWFMAISSKKDAHVLPYQIKATLLKKDGTKTAWQGKKEYTQQSVILGAE